MNGRLRRPGVFYFTSFLLIWLAAIVRQAPAPSSDLWVNLRNLDVRLTTGIGQKIDVGRIARRRPGGLLHFFESRVQGVFHHLDDISVWFRVIQAREVAEVKGELAVQARFTAGSLYRLAILPRLLSMSQHGRDMPVLFRIIREMKNLRVTAL